MKKLIAYLNEVLGEELMFRPFKNERLKELPLYITASYDFFLANIAGNQICFLVANKGEISFTPDQLAKQTEVISSKLNLYVVFIFDKIESYNIGRLIKKKVNFIVTGKQLYIPALLMHLKKTPDKPQKEILFLTPTAQLILFYHLIKESLSGKTAKQIGNIVGQEYRTVIRAINNLAYFNLLSFEGAREKHIRFNYKGVILWDKSQKYLQNPAERVVYTDESLPVDIMCLSNINALSHYTMLNDDMRKYFAVYKRDINKLKVKKDKFFGDNIIEAWRYDPKILSDDIYVDRLSLYLLLKENEDDRVQGELKQLLMDIKWLTD